MKTLVDWLCEVYEGTSGYVFTVVWPILAGVVLLLVVLQYMRMRKLIRRFVNRK